MAAMARAAARTKTVAAVLAVLAVCVCVRVSAARCSGLHTFCVRNEGFVGLGMAWPQGGTVQHVSDPTSC